MPAHLGRTTVLHLIAAAGAAATTSRDGLIVAVALVGLVLLRCLAQSHLARAGLVVPAGAPHASQDVAAPASTGAVPAAPHQPAPNGVL